MHSNYQSTVSRRSTAYNRSNSNSSKSHPINDSSLWTSTVPRLPDDFSNESFSSGLVKLKAIIEWVERQSDILNGLLTNTQFEIMSQDMNNVCADIKQGFDHLHRLVTDSHHTSTSYSQDKARLHSLQQQWQQIKKSTDTVINRHQRRIKIENSKGKLLNNAKGGKGWKAQLSRADELSSLQASQGIVDSALEALSNVKTDLFDQKSLLKQTRKKILDLGNLVGFSNSLVGVIMKRTMEDQWILYGGMILTLLVIFLLWYYFM